MLAALAAGWAHTPSTLVCTAVMPNQRACRTAASQAGSAALGASPSLWHHGTNRRPGPLFLRAEYGGLYAILDSFPVGIFHYLSPAPVAFEFPFTMGSLGCAFYKIFQLPSTLSARVVSCPWVPPNMRASD